MLVPSRMVKQLYHLAMCMAARLHSQVMLAMTWLAKIQEHVNKMGNGVTNSQDVSVSETVYFNFLRGLPENLNNSPTYYIYLYQHRGEMSAHARKI